MTSALRAVFSLLVAVLFVVTANGILNTLIPLGARAAKMTSNDIALISSVYFAGMLAGAMASPWLIRRVGHVRAFSATVSACAVAALAMPIFVSFPAWALWRGLMGFAFAVFYATVEAWLQGRSDNSVRGQVLGVYSVVQYAGVALGNGLLGLDEPTSFTLFSLAAACLAAATIPLSLSSQEPPEGPSSHALRLGWFWKLSPVAFVASILVGSANSPMWTFAPIWAAERGFSPAEVGQFVSAMTLGGAAAQIPVGRISDRTDRRLVLIGLCLACGAIEIGLFVTGAALGKWPLFALMFLLGATLTTQYYAAAAHANDRAGPEDAVTISSVLLFLYCAGAILGPLSTTPFIDRMGTAGVYVHNALVHVGLAAFVAYRMIARARASGARAPDLAAKPPG